MGQSEDWSQVVDQLTSHRPVIRLNYAEPVIGTDSANPPGSIRFRQIELWQLSGLVARIAFTLLAIPLEPRWPHPLRRSIPEVVSSLVLVSGFSYGGDPRMRLQFDLWLHLARTDKIALTKLLLVSGLSRDFLSAFDENTINGIVQGALSTLSDSFPESSRIFSRSPSRRGCAGAGQEDQGTDIINHREIRPDSATLL